MSRVSTAALAVALAAIIVVAVVFCVETVTDGTLHAPYDSKSGLFYQIMYPVQQMWAQNGDPSRVASEFLEHPDSAGLFAPSARSQYQPLQGNTQLVLPHFRRQFAKRMRAAGLAGADWSSGHVFETPVFGAIRRQAHPLVSTGPFAPSVAVRAAADAKWQGLFGTSEKPVVGVHLRWMKFADGSPFFKGVDVSAEAHVANLAQTANGLCSRLDTNAVLVISNNKPLKRQFVDAMGPTKSVASTDPDGSVDNVGDDWPVDHGRQSLFWDAMIDVLLLARCTAMVVGPSNVALMAMILNPSATVTVPPALLRAHGS